MCGLLHIENYRSGVKAVMALSKTSANHITIANTRLCEEPIGHRQGLGQNAKLCGTCASILLHQAVPFAVAAFEICGSHHGEP